MKRFILALTFVAGTASADTTQDLADCYYDRGLRAMGMDPENLSPFLVDESERLRWQLWKMADSALRIYVEAGSVDAVNIGTRLGTVGKPELRAAFVGCNNRFMDR